MKTTITDFIDNDHRSHYWYGGECARVEHKGYIATIKAAGDVYAEYAPGGEYRFCVKDKNNAGYFYNEMRDVLRSDEALYKAIENGDLIIDNNNWWECFIIDPKGNFHDWMWALDADYLDDAIQEVKESFDEMIAYIEEGLRAMSKQINWARVHAEMYLSGGKPRIKTLSEDQYNVLCKIAEETKMDCWFCIKQHVRGKHAGEDYVFDLENNKVISLKKGVNELVEGITEQDLENLTDEEIHTLENILIYI